VTVSTAVCQAYSEHASYCRQSTARPSDSLIKKFVVAAVATSQRLNRTLVSVSS